MSDIKFEIVTEEPDAPQYGPRSKYEEALRAVEQLKSGQWLKVPVSDVGEATRLRNTLSGLLRRRGITHRTAVRPEHGDTYAVYITRSSPGNAR